MKGFGSQKGYALLDVAIAVTIFAFAVGTLSVCLNQIISTSNDFSRQRVIQNAIESYLTETKRKPVVEMTSEYYDEVLDVTFRSEVEALEVANADGGSLDDLYTLKVYAEYELDGEQQIEVTEMYIYQPEER